MTVMRKLTLLLLCLALGIGVCDAKRKIEGCIFGQMPKSCWTNLISG